MSNLFSSTVFEIDTLPDSFTFLNQTNAPVNTLVTCVTVVTVAGINTPTVAVTLSGSGEYRKNGGSWGTAAGTAANGDTFEVRHTTATNTSTAVNTTLAIGATSATFTSTTIAGAGEILITAPSVIVHGAGYTILGQEFETPQGSGYVTLDNGIVIDSQEDIASWADGEIVLNNDTSLNLPYGPLTLSVTNDSGKRGSFPLNLIWDTTTHQVVSISAAPNTGEGSLLDLTYTAPVAEGDLLEIDAPASQIAVDADGNWIALDGSYSYSLVRRIYRNADAFWSTSLVSVYEVPLTQNFDLESVYGDSADFSIETNVGAGEIVWFVSPSANPPSIEDLIAGVGASSWGTSEVSAPGTVLGSASLAIPDTQYFLHVAHANGTAYSSISTSEGFTSTWEIEDFASLIGPRGIVSGYGTVTVPTAPPPIDPGEPNLTGMGLILKGRLARFTASTSLDTFIMAELQQAQRTLEEDSFLPWFLEKEDISSLETTPGVALVPWPADFLRELDEDYRSSFSVREVGSTRWLPLTKTDQETIDAWADATGLPSRYCVSGMNYCLGRIPDDTYLLRLRYFARAEQLTEEVTENLWTKNASEYLIAQAGFRLAGMYLKNDTAMKIFLADIGRERSKLINRHTAHFEANRERMDED